MRKHYAIPRYPQEMEVGRHPVLQLVDGACPNEICRSERESHGLRVVLQLGP